MSAGNLIQELENMLKLHKSLLNVALKKKDIIIKGNADELQSCLLEEKKHVKAIQSVGVKMQKSAEAFLTQNETHTEQPSLAAAIKAAANEEKDKLSNLKTELESVIIQLRKQNDINQSLLEQSLAFVNMSLDLLIPDLELFNYERPEQNLSKDQSNRSIFDSKA